MPKIDSKESQRITKKAEGLKKERDSKWLPKWKDQRDFLSPADGQFEGDQINDGKRRDQRITNQRAVLSAKRAAAGMTSGMASQARPWFTLEAPDGVVKSFRVTQWLYQVQEAIRAVLNKSNAYNIIPQGFHTQVVYGTCAIAALPDEADVVRFYHYPVGTFSLATSARGQVDTFYREYTMTPRQMAQQFGLENLSINTKGLAERGESTNICVKHLIEPNPDADMTGTRVDNKSMPWLSTYWESGADPDMVLRQGGFKSFPIMAPRWDVNGTNVYGTGPGDIALGKSRELQLLESDKLRVVQQYGRPSVAGPISMRGQHANLAPGGIVWMPDALVGVGFRPTYEPNPATLPNLRAEINECEQAIAEAFYEDLFLMISQMDDVRTATEIAARKEEKMSMLGPVVERNNDELFDPMIDQVFSILYEQSLPRWMGLLPGQPLIPPPPEELNGVPLRVEYTSILAQAQKALAVGSIERALQFTGYLVGAGVQDAFDKIDTDAAQDFYYNAVGAPPTILRDNDQVASIRQGRAQVQQQQLAAEQGLALVEGAKTLAETPTGGDTALSALAAAAAQ